MLSFSIDVFTQCVLLHGTVIIFKFNTKSKFKDLSNPHFNISILIQSNQRLLNIIRVTYFIYYEFDTFIIILSEDHTETRVEIKLVNRSSLSTDIPRISNRN